MIGFGIAMGALGITLVMLPYLLPEISGIHITNALYHARVASLGAFVAGLYFLSEGVGAVLFSRSSVGVLMLIWAMIVWTGWRITAVFL
ncbi:MAG: hypothetical protein HC765_13545 [Brachymonas sp.]|nr:hypothetical protein [Brachymonas sp.]